MKKLIILGGSGIGMIAASIAKALGEYEILGFLNDVIPNGSHIGKFGTIPVIGNSDNIKKYLNDPSVYFFVAYVGMQSEREVYDKLLKMQIPPDRFATLIHPTAVIPNDFCSIGKGVLMAPLAQLSPDTTVEDNCILLPNSFLGHDSTMKRFSHIATNGVVGANVVLGHAVHVGSNATIREKVTIGNFSLIGAGSVVLNDVPEEVVVVGNPAKILKSKSDHGN